MNTSTFTGEQTGKRKPDFEMLVSTMLRSGVSLCLLLLAIGSILSFVHHPDYRVQTQPLHHLTTSGAVFPHTLAQLKASLLAGRGQGFTTLGLLVLIATPIMRVAVSALAFSFERDRAFVLITLTVLGLLLISLFVGHSLQLAA